MVTNPKTCTVEGCEKKVAYAFNQLCNTHWDERINDNIQLIVQAIKEEKK